MFAFLGCQKESNKNKSDVLKFCLSLSSVSFSSETAFKCMFFWIILIKILLFYCCCFFQFFSDSQLFYYLSCLPLNHQIIVITVHTIQPGKKEQFSNNHDKFLMRILKTSYIYRLKPGSSNWLNIVNCSLTFDICVTLLLYIMQQKRFRPEVAP